MPPNAQNLVLIGMPASGKSTLGLMVAKELGWDFLDTDVLVQVREGRPLKALIAGGGRAGFRRLETRHVCSLRLRQTVVATGGSVVYSPEAMAHLGGLGLIVWLQVSLAELDRRIGDLGERGVLHRPGETLGEVLRQREPLYRRYAQASVTCDHKSPAQIVSDLKACLAGAG